MKNILLIYLAYCCATPLLAMPQNDTTSFILPIQEVENGFAGEGVEWILQHAENQQFVLFGEQHGVAGVAKFAAFTFEQLYSEGFHHLVLETDNWTTNQLNQNGLDFTISNYPHLLAFDYDEDLDLIDRALSHQQSAGGEIWGVDQSFIAIHPYKRLAEIAPNANARRLARGAYLKASLRMGRYIREDHLVDFPSLEEVFGEQSNQEISFILRELKSSMNIYSIWASGEWQASSAIREQFMKDKLDQYLLNTKDPIKPPKAIFKMGGAHTINGVGPNGVLTLGDHAKKIAEKNQLSTLCIGIRRFNPEIAMIDSTAFTEVDIVLLDTKKLKEVSTDSSTYTDSQKMGLNGYDAIIYFKDALRAKKKIILTHENSFKTNLIKSLIPLAVLLLLCFSSVVPGLVTLLRRKVQNKLPVLCLWLSCIALMTLIGIQIWWIIGFPQHSTTIVSSSQSLMIFLLFFAATVYPIISAIQSWRKSWWRKGFRIYFSIITVSYSGLAYLAYHWNLGGMLG